jgi:hypothetical protein
MGKKDSVSTERKLNLVCSGFSGKIFHRFVQSFEPISKPLRKVERQVKVFIKIWLFSFISQQAVSADIT